MALVSVHRKSCKDLVYAIYLSILQSAGTHGLKGQQI